MAPNMPVSNSQGRLHVAGAPEGEDLDMASKLVVVKVGTSSLIRPETQAINLSTLARLCETVALMHTNGHRVIIVTSGGVGVGAQRMGLAKKPTEIPKKQALSAIGQLHLMKHYDDMFIALNKRCAQVLITLENISDRAQYLNTRQTLKALFDYGVIPIVNENDTVAIHELKIGDNDTMAAQVASLVGADYCFLLTDVNGLYSSNPNNDPDAKLIEVVEDISQLAVDTGSTDAPGGAAGSEFGTGGMVTKLTAARIATSAGCKMVICNATRLAEIGEVIEGKSVGTLFLPPTNIIHGRKRWILSMPARGRIVLDDGAVRAVMRHKNVFASGLLEVVGKFGHQSGISGTYDRDKTPDGGDKTCDKNQEPSGDAIHLVDKDGNVIASGLSNYTADELRKLKGLQSDRIEEVLGFNGPSEILYRTNICVFKDEDENDTDSDEDNEN